MALFSHYAICAAKQALNDAEWKPTADSEKDRTVMCNQKSYIIFDCKKK